MKVAVLADLHLPARSDTVKESILDWALTAAVEHNADLIAGAGDLTSLGELASARRIMQKLQTVNLPFIHAPGNAELRTPADSKAVLELMSTPSIFPGTVAVDSSHRKLSEASSALLQELLDSNHRNLLLISHCPPAAWEEQDLELLSELIDKKIISRVVYGHRHIDIEDGINSCIRGLDPDKASGGAPALVFFTREPDGSWKREDVVCPLADAAGFPKKIRRNILDSIGISGMKTPLENLALAIEKKLPVFEIRFAGNADFPSPELREAVALWRKNGGRYLSMHLVDLVFDGKNFSGMEMLHTAVCAAIKLGCDGVTFHVPRGFADELNNPATLARAAKIVSDCFRELFEHNISVGVENLHTSAAEREQKRYKFGCLPDECMAFINALRELNPGKKIGLHLDIGHARNNAPFSNKSTLSDWYAACGKEIVAMHIHQVSMDENGTLKNHTGFTDFYGKLISLSSLAMARRSGSIGAVPMILELRAPAEDSLHTLQKVLMP